MADEWLTKNFTRSEFACRCGCGFDGVDLRVPRILQQIRDHYGAAVIVTSGCRCDRHNRSSVGGSPRSQHLLGKAADIVVSGVPPSEVADYIDEHWPHTLGLGRYDTFTHLDVRRLRARWG